MRRSFKFVQGLREAELKHANYVGSGRNTRDSPVDLPALFGDDRRLRRYGFRLAQNQQDQRLLVERFAIHPKLGSARYGCFQVQVVQRRSKKISGRNRLRITYINCYRNNYNTDVF